MQEAGSAGQRFGQGRRAQATATQEFEAADAHRLGEQAETFVVELAIQQVVERGIALDRNPAGGVCNVNAGRGQQRRRVDMAALQPGQHPADKPHCNSGLRSGLAIWCRGDGAFLANFRC